jgi:NADH-quinone oxidoreductase subunit N
MNSIIASALLGVGMMFSGIIFRKSQQIQWAAILSIVILMAVSIVDYVYSGEGTQVMYGMIEISQQSAWFNVLITFCCVVYFFIFHKHIAEVGKNDAEYFALIFFVMCGVYLLTSYSNLLILFIGIEILSIPQYILAGSDKESFKSNEASLKYFLMGAFSTGILLMGMALLYGASGSFDVLSSAFMQQFQSVEGMSSMSVVGILLMIISFAFKVSAAPMHMWTPDVYDGTPTAFTPFMATIVKVSVFVAFMRLFQYSFHNVANSWQVIIVGIIALTLLIGNVTAVYQQSVKRMMAYSSIAQAGFMLFSIFALNATAIKGMTLYSVAYTLASLGVFAVLVKMKDYTYDGFNGMAKKYPVLAFTAAICLFSLVGIPLTGGFFAKYMVLSATMEQGKMIGIIIFAVLMAAVSAYYYFKVIMSMYFKDGEVDLQYQPTQAENALLIINAIMVIILGLMPEIVF